MESVFGLMCGESHRSAVFVCKTQLLIWHQALRCDVRVYLGAGECFGEYASLVHMPRSATILAASSTVLLEINRLQFDQFLESTNKSTNLFSFERHQQVKARTFQVACLNLMVMTIIDICIRLWICGHKFRKTAIIFISLAKSPKYASSPRKDSPCCFT